MDIIFQIVFKVVLLALIVLSIKMDGIDGNGTCYSTEACLYDYLLTDYNNQVRPAYGPNDTVDVNLSVDLYSILNMDEKNEVMHSVLGITAIWYDNWLTWDLANYSIPLIVVNVKKLWLPDFAVTNSVDKFYQTTFLEDFKAVVNNDGYVIWEYAGIFKTACSLDISRYPFDSQQCTIVIENWAYRSSLVNLTSADFYTDSYEVNGLWDLVSSSVETDFFYLYGFEYPRQTYYINLKRKPNYYTLNIILPCALVLMAALGVFWLPADCGEKISLGITVLLAFSVFQIVIMDNTPVNSDNSPFLSKLVISIMTMATISVVSSMLTTYLHFKGSAVRAPKWLRKLFFKILAKIVFLTREANIMLDNADEDIVKSFNNDVNKFNAAEGLETKFKLDKEKASTELGAILKELMMIRKCMQDQKDEEIVMNEWKLLAKILDRMFFWGSCVLLVVIIIVISI